MDETRIATLGWEPGNFPFEVFKIMLTSKIQQQVTNILSRTTKIVEQITIILSPHENMTWWTSTLGDHTQKSYRLQRCDQLFCRSLFRFLPTI